MTLAVRQSSAERLLRWPSEVSHTFETTDSSALSYALPAHVDGLMDPVTSVPGCWPCHGFGGFAPVAWGLSASATSLAALDDTHQTSVCQPLPVPCYADQGYNIDARPLERSHEATTPRQGKLHQRKKLPGAPVSSSHATSTLTDSYNAKTVKANHTQDPKQWSEFDTSVDRLMRVIQKEESSAYNKDDIYQWILTPSPSPSPKMEASSPLLADLPVLDLDEPTLSYSFANETLADVPTQRRRKPKKFRCTGPNCDMVFAQKGHLVIHLRSHTGEKPFKCEYDGCDQHFSQRGNMKTHMRRHVGDKPYKCRYCDKAFVQASIARTHEQTHNPCKPFPCILDGCTKSFSSRGNMKQHQNVIHKRFLHDLIREFEGYAAQDMVPAELRELFEYFKVHYKNSNKGVKGRGKDHNVATRSTKSMVAHAKLEATLHEDLKVESPSAFGSPSWGPYSPGILEMLAPPSPLSVAGQIFPERDDYATLMTTNGLLFLPGSSHTTGQELAGRDKSPNNSWI